LRREHDVRRFAGEACAGDLIFHDIEGICQYVKVCWRHCLRRKQLGRDPRRLVAQRGRKLFKQLSQKLRTDRSTLRYVLRSIVSLKAPADQITIEVHRDDNVGAKGRQSETGTD
jgi:hypothetical protein